MAAFLPGSGASSLAASHGKDWGNGLPADGSIRNLERVALGSLDCCWRQSHPSAENLHQPGHGGRIYFSRDLRVGWSGSLGCDADACWHLVWLVAVQRM